MKAMFDFRWSLASLGWLLAVLSAAAINVPDYAVQVSAQVQTAPAQITLVWPADPDSTAYTLYRKTRDATSWGTPTTLATNATSYVDTNVAVGQTYEYRIVKNANESGSSYTGYGYIYAGIQAPLVEARGKVLLLVDNTMISALAFELNRLQLDLAGDGWTVLRYDVPRQAIAASDVSSNNWPLRANELALLKDLIVTNYNADPANVKSVFLFGHVPVPYSGYLCPDGHTDHCGAWPADIYYGDMDGVWTDNSTTATNGLGRNDNRNVPGDGKFDQTSPPSTVELQVGRVDLWNMTSFPQTETELLRQYLNKEHNFRLRYVNPPRRGLVDDHFGTFYGEAFAVNGYRNFAPFFGVTNIVAGPWFSTLVSNSYLWGHACGPGSYASEGGVGVTADFAATNTQVTFTMHFGSYFGDYDAQNDLMRAQLANAGGGLTCMWAGRPHMFFHQMALGETVGYSAQRTENYGGTLYNGYTEVHVNLLGDPTLRMHVVAPPAALAVTDQGGGARALRWRASPDMVLGYHVYGAASSGGPFVRLNSDAVSGTNFTDAASDSALYMVRAVKLEASASGTYTNASQGIFENLSSTFSPPYVTLRLPTNSAMFSLETPIPFAVETSDANNDITQVEFYTNGVLFTTATVWPYAFTWTNAWLGTYAIKAVVRDAAGLSATSAVANVTVTYNFTTLVASKSVWKYYDQMNDLGTAWRAPDYDDSAWLSGPAQIGFGDGDEATAIDSNRLRITTYFRKSFVPPPNGMYLGLTVRLLRDDGGVVYLNGTEVFRSNMPTNQTILWATQASANALAADETTTFYANPVNLALLHAGTNVLAVEIHQFGTNSSDISFDLDLLATNLPTVFNTAPVISSVVPNVSTDEDTLSAAVPFTVGDRESWPEGLTVTVTSSNPSLVSSNNVMFSGTGSNRFLAILPATNQNGSAIVTLTVSDGLASASTNFNLTVNPVSDPPNIAWVGWTNGTVLAAGQITLNVNASDPDGNLAFVQYFLDGALFGQSSNAPYSFVWSNAPMGYHRLQARAVDTTSLTGETSNLFVSVLGAPATLVSPGALWKYWDRGSLPATNWFSLAYSDAAWPSGPSPLGYGDANGVWPATTNSFGPDSNNKYVTTYYRSTFTIASAAGLANLAVNIQRDDGLVLYLNGVDIYRNNMPTGAVSYTNWATATVSGVDEVAWFTNAVSTGLLVNGANLLAAEVHQVTTNSSDIYFNLRLTGQPTLQQPAVAAAAGPEQVQFSWPAWAAGLSLWAADNLTPPVAWLPVTNAVFLTNGQPAVTVPASGRDQRFFRLQGW